MSGLFGCCVFVNHEWQHLPQVALKAHATILSSASQTTLTQTFTNPLGYALSEVNYIFPLYDGVSVVGFQCRVGNRLLYSKVKSKEQANADYEEATRNNETAALMEHTAEENDVFMIRIGNVQAKEIITVDTTFIGELKQDAQTDGIRYTLPNAIAPRYASASGIFHGDHLFSPFSSSFPAKFQGISITVDVQMGKNSIIRELQSPSHSIKTFLGRTSSTQDSSSFEPSQASAALHLTKDNQPLLERDFVLLVKADGLDNPGALLESHPTIPGQRALMATLVPKFNLPPAQPEIVFVIDRSSSMGDKTTTLQSALRIFLKSLPLGICFNICSFGTWHSFLWSTSKVYDQSSLQQALLYIDHIHADMGGTNMQPAVEAVVNNRLKNKDLEVLLLTDGAIYNQQSLFSFVRDAAADNTARFFSLGFGDAASHSLVEGIARSGNGVSQSVLRHEELDRKVVRMLKGALTPHIYDYKLQVEYDTMVDGDFEVVENVDYPMQGSETDIEDQAAVIQTPQKPISLFDENYKESNAELGATRTVDDKNLPKLTAPKVLQAPYKIPSLYPFIRSTVYLLLDPKSTHRIPQSLTFTATSKQGPLQLRIPISDLGKGETIHQLASRKAMIELEELHGWLEKTKDSNGNPFTQLHSDTKQRLATRECQALGIRYQVTGKHCSFVALEEDSSASGKDQEKGQPGENKAQTISRGSASPVASRFMSASGKGGVNVLYSSAPTQQMYSGPIGGSMMGRAPPATSSAGLFGNRTQPASSLFGGSRGSTPNSQSGLFGGQPSPSSGLFACSAVADGPSSGSLFGSVPTGGFGAPTPQRGPLFGSAQNVQFPVRPACLGQSATSSFPGSVSTGGFGASAAQQGTLFGSTQNNPSPARTACFGQSTTGFSHGSVSTGGFGAPAPQRGPLFGSAQNVQFPVKPAFFGQSATVSPLAQTAPPPSSGQSEVHSLVALQSFSGNWELNQELCTLLGCDLNKVYNSFLELTQTTNISTNLTNALATIMAMGFLANKHADSRSVWELVFGKAEAWLNDTVPGLGIAGAMIDAKKAQIMSLEFLK
ncbi:uncharacterized protein N7498_001350 [Penicillium cinerascens]|uniref:VIT domain-containing protein n=1 Tax=Penicillium cinerascens TaxID=70096 RepID=A0A9W9NG46_9EURO|nr:uncharacterized protein N7498_001350 [Penicillium cinerascens]KAJ5219251.1 hypothetical protein N7498_001350 [Penicillium cinerascens]